MTTDLAESIPYVTKSRKSIEAFAVELRLSVDVLLQINPHLEEVTNLIPGIPVNLPPKAAQNLFSRNSLAGTGEDKAATPLDAATVEWERAIENFSGLNDSNPEIEKYLATTSGVAPDDVTWCSSFVNWCVRESGRIGTDNSTARSWHHWGKPTENPKRGDIAVFKLKDSTWKGHVGFFFQDDGTSIRLLGGSRGNRVQLSNYPKNGAKYALLSIRKV